MWVWVCDNRMRCQRMWQSPLFNALLPTSLQLREDVKNSFFVSPGRKQEGFVAVIYTTCLLGDTESRAQNATYIAFKVPKTQDSTVTAALA